DQLNKSTFSLAQLVGGGQLSESLVVAMLTDEARKLGLGEKEIAATIQSGMRAGMAQPRYAPVSTNGKKPTTLRVVTDAPANQKKTQSIDAGKPRTPEPGKRPMIEVAGGYRPIVVDACERVLGENFEPLRVFQASARLVRLF